MFLIGLLILALQLQAQDPLPIVYIHGISDSCMRSGVAKKQRFEKYFPNTSFHCIEYGVDKNTWHRTVKTQMDLICQNINENPDIPEEFNLFGESHGGFLTQLLITTGCLKKKVRNYVSNCGVHRGVAYDLFQECNNLRLNFLSIFLQFFNVSFLISRYKIQHPICWADYIFDKIQDVALYPGPLSYVYTAGLYPKMIKKHSLLTQNLNENEYDPIRKERLMSLNYGMYLAADNDHRVLPNVSAHFRRTIDGKTGDEYKKILSKDEDPFFTQDLLGVQAMTDLGKFQFEFLKGNHTIMTDEEFEKWVIPAFQK